MTQITLNDQAISLLLDNDIADQLTYHALPHIAFDGWGNEALCKASDDCNISHHDALVILSGGASEMIARHVAISDKMMQVAFDNLANHNDMGVTAKIRTLIEIRFWQNRAYRDQIRQACAILALPHHFDLGARLLYQSCDAMWSCAARDKADYSFYSKRIILSAVYSSALLIWLDDDSDDMTTTMDFVDRRLSDVHHYSKAISQKKLSSLCDVNKLSQYAQNLSLYSPLRRFKAMRSFYTKQDIYNHKYQP